MATPLGTLSEPIGSIYLEIVAIKDGVAFPAGETHLELSRCSDGTLVLGAQRPKGAPLSVGFRAPELVMAQLADMIAKASKPAPASAPAPVLTSVPRTALESTLPKIPEDQLALPGTDAETRS
jgi:hypothetical protein